MAVRYNLTATSISINYDRSGALAAVLPGATNPVLIDLGQFRVTINIEGFVAPTGGTPTADGANVIPTKDQLETILDQLNNSRAQEIGVPVKPYTI